MINLPHGSPSNPQPKKLRPLRIHLLRLTTTWKVKDAPSVHSCFLCGPLPGLWWLRKPAHRQSGDCCTPHEVTRGHRRADVKQGAPSRPRLRSLRSSQFPPGTRQLLPFTGHFLLQLPAPPLLPPLKAHSCLHPNPKLHCSLYGLRPWRATLLCPL